MQRESLRENLFEKFDRFALRRDENTIFRVNNEN